MCLGIHRYRTDLKHDRLNEFVPRGDPVSVAAPVATHIPSLGKPSNLRFIFARQYITKRCGKLIDPWIVMSNTHYAFNMNCFAYAWGFTQHNLHQPHEIQIADVANDDSRQPVPLGIFAFREINTQAGGINTRSHCITTIND